ncbi:hypothetical protein IIA79_07350, partial [bacterium]|nr:hypothetical protein [bacterium]
YREDIVEGLENTPDAFIGLLGGGVLSPLAGLFAATPDAGVLGVNTDVVFTVGLSLLAGDPLAAEVIEVDEGGAVIQVLGNLLDDGEPASGDESAFDRVFSYKSQLVSAEESVAYYRARITYDAGGGERTVYSNIEGFQYYEELSDVRAQEILDQATGMQAELETLAESMVLTEAAAQLLEELENDGSILEAGLTVSGEGVWWITAEGIHCMASILGTGGSGTSSLATPLERSRPNILSADELDPHGHSLKSVAGAQEAKLGWVSNIRNYNVLVLAPFAEGLSALRAVDDVAAIMQKLEDNACPKFKVTYFSGEDASIARFKEMDEYGIILVSSYGDVVRYATGSVLEEQTVLTGERVTRTNLKAYKSEIAAGSQATFSRTLTVHGKGYYGIIPEFIYKHCRGMPNSIIYMCSERSMYGETLARYCVNEAGAGVFFGYRQSVIPRNALGRQFGSELFTGILGGLNAGKAYSNTQQGLPSDPDPPVDKYEIDRFDYYGNSFLVVAESVYRICEIPPLGPSGTDPLGGDLSWANDVNRNGQVVGRSTYPEGNWTGFLWELHEGGKMTKIGNLGGHQGEAMAINEKGQVVGWAQNHLGDEHAFLWQDGNLTDLGTLGLSSVAYDINNSGVIVGETDVEGLHLEDHPCIFTNPGITDLGNFGTGSPTFSLPENGEAVAV